MTNNIEEELDKMLKDLNVANDEFVNNYFDDEEPKEAANSVEEIKESEPIPEAIPETAKRFSYNDILDRLDYSEKQVPQPVAFDKGDLMSLIDKSSNSDEFFDKVEQVIDND